MNVGENVKQAILEALRTAGSARNELACKALSVLGAGVVDDAVSADDFDFAANQAGEAIDCFFELERTLRKILAVLGREEDEV